MNLHIVYDRRVLDEPFAAGVGTPVQYLFDRGEAAGAPRGCQYLAVSLSGASREMGCSVEQLRERYLPAMSELLPAARTARVERFQVTREHAATFRAAPGVRRAAPTAAHFAAGPRAGRRVDGNGLAGDARGRGAERPRRRAGRGGGVSELLLAAPLRVEAALISSAARGAAVHKTGMGPARARAAAGELGTHTAQAMLVLGFCGGLDEHSVPGEVIVAEEVYAALDENHPEPRVRCGLTGELVARLTGLGMKVRVGNVVCVSKIAVGERRAQLHASGAIAVDMESVWLAGAAGERPFGVVRVVLDSPSHELLRPQAVGGALRAALALRKVAGALHDWAPSN